MITIKENQLTAYDDGQAIPLPYFTNADSEKLVNLENNVGAISNNVNSLQSHVNTIDNNIDTIDNEVDNLKELSVYSTKETVVGTWIDGKPIYRQIITGVAGNKDIATISDLDMIVSMRGIIKSNYNHWWPIPTFYSTQNYNTYIYCTLAGVLRIETGSYYDSTKPFFVIVEYTKTTD